MELDARSVDADASSDGTIGIYGKDTANFPEGQPHWVDKDGVPHPIAEDDGTASSENTITTIDASAQTIATIAIPDDTVMVIEAHILGRRTDSPGRAGYVRRATVYREAAGVAVIEGAVDTAYSRESDSAWNVTIDVNGNDARIRVQGAVGSTVNFKSIHTTRAVS